MATYAIPGGVYTEPATGTFVVPLSGVFYVFVAPIPPTPGTRTPRLLFSSL